MICPKCKGRWAPFPEDDFKFIAGQGFVSKNPGAEAKRGIIFDSDNSKYCGCEDEDWEYDKHYRTQHKVGSMW